MQFDVRVECEDEDGPVMVEIRVDAEDPVAALQQGKLDLRQLSPKLAKQGVCVPLQPAIDVLVVDAQEAAAGRQTKQIDFHGDLVPLALRIGAVLGAISLWVMAFLSLMQISRTFSS